MSITNSVNNRFKSIYNALYKTENIGLNISNELSNQTESINNMNDKSSILFNNLLLNQQKLNSIISSFPKININIPFLKKENSKATNKSVICDIHHSGRLNEHNNIVQSEIKCEFENTWHSENIDELDKISVKLKQLKNIALDINSEIKKQNIVIDEITKTVEDSSEINLKITKKIETL